MARFCSKHGQHELHRAEQVPYLVEGLAAIMGGEEALRQSNAYSLIYCPVAPLTHDGPMLDAYLELGEWNLPVMMMPMPVNGTTGPASLFSNLALANAEALSTIVIFQLAHPGRPLIYASATGIVDFRSGAYLAGVPEMGLQSAALTAMGKYYGLPTGAAGFTSDAKQPGPEAVHREADHHPAGGDGGGGYHRRLRRDRIRPGAVPGADRGRQRAGPPVPAPAGGRGQLTRARFLRRYPGGGPGRALPQAAQHAQRRPAARSSTTPRLIDRSPYETWLELGKPSMYAKAREEVRAHPGGAAGRPAAGGGGGEVG